MNCQALRLAYLHQRRLIRRLQAELADVKAEEDNSYQLVARQGALLTGVVNALRGNPPPDTMWSHHDAVELAEKMMAELAEVKRDIDRSNRVQTLEAELALVTADRDTLLKMTGTTLEEVAERLRSVRDKG